ncbi:MAG: NAD(P)H-hydrate epimerase [Chloroflexota bacterium]
MRVPLVTAAEMHAIEEQAVDRGATWHGLMDTAGKKLAAAVIGRLGPQTEQRVLVLVGPGNNGGDGLVAARHLSRHGWEVRCLLWERLLAGDERLRVPLAQQKVPVIDLVPTGPQTTVRDAVQWSSVILDGLLGTGLKRDIEGALAALVRTVAASGKQVIAIDIPSGVDSDTGAIRGVALPANMTVTFGYSKYGQYLHPGKVLRGDIRVEDIGVDAIKTVKGGELLTDESVRALLPARPDDGNKGTFGKAFVVAGSVNYIGAPALAVQGAMRVGAGLVTLGCPGDLLAILATKLTECTFMPLPSDMGSIAAHAIDKLFEELKGYNVLLVGCGLGQDKGTVAFLKSLFAKPATPTHGTPRPIGFAARAQTEEKHDAAATHLPALVIDGDALNILAQWKEWHAHVPTNSVFTPHPGEMARLLDSTVEAVQADRVNVAKDAAAEWKQVVVLKGAGTVIAAPDGRIFVSPFSNPALATAGSGDVLAGAIAGLVAQGLDAVDAACAGVYLHGLAGELLRMEYGVAGGISGDLPILLARAQYSLRNAR